MGAEDIKMSNPRALGGHTGLAKTDVYTGGYGVENESAELGRAIIRGQRKNTSPSQVVGVGVTMEEKSG